MADVCVLEAGNDICWHMCGCLGLACLCRLLQTFDFAALYWFIWCVVENLDTAGEIALSNLRMWAFATSSAQVIHKIDRLICMLLFEQLLACAKSNTLSNQNNTESDRHLSQTICLIQAQFLISNTSEPSKPLHRDKHKTPESVSKTQTEEDDWWKLSFSCKAMMLQGCDKAATRRYVWLTVLAFLRICRCIIP